jgi:hypothetical protein
MQQLRFLGPSTVKLATDGIGRRDDDDAIGRDL